MIAEDSENVVNFRVLRRRNYPYIFIWVVYYAWVVVFTTWWTASPLIDKVYGVGTRNILHSVNLLSSAVFVFVIKREWYARTAKIGSVFILAGMAAFLLFKNEFPVLSAASAAITGIFLGCVNISILIPFVFLLNNTEKFYAVVGSNILISILSFIKDLLESSFVPGSAGALLSFAVLILCLYAVLFFKEDEELSEPVESVGMPSRIYMTLVINCVFAAMCNICQNSAS